MEKPFVGRQRELGWLRSRVGKGIASFIVIRGRRRIGKSRLIREFAHSLKSYIFSGLPIDRKTTRKGQIQEFCQQVCRAFELPEFRANNWGEVFALLGRLCSSGPVVIALDEISWIGSKDPQFLGQLKNAWDLHFSQNPELILIVSGSVSSWIERNILSHTGFVGRISVDLKLEELSLKESTCFWGAKRGLVSPHEIISTLCVTGGVPRYLEEIETNLSVEENIRRLCFDRNGLLFREFDQIFSDLFSSRSATYAKIVTCLASGPKTRQQIAEAMGKASNTISPYLEDLIQAGFICADFAWNLKTTKTSQLKNFRLSDNYLRFYLKYVRPQSEAISKGVFNAPIFSDLPNWHATMGLQFENLVLNNIQLVLDAIRLPPSKLVRFGPYFQTPTKRKKGCQIDLLLQASNRAVYICETKFSQNKIGLEVLSEFDRKVEALALPRGWSARTVLIHVNGVTAEVHHAEALDHLVDFSEPIRNSQRGHRTV